MKKIPSSFINIMFISLLVFLSDLTAQDSGIDFNFKKEPIDKVIGFLIVAYKMPIAYQDQQIRGITITANCKNCSQDQAIRTILQSTPISAYQFKTQIILTKDKTKHPDGERNRIIGRIIDAREGSSLPYANILVKEYKKGTSSDLHGEFILEDLPAESFVLKVLYIGYKEKEQLITGPFKGQDTLTIALNEDYLESDTIAVLGQKPYPIRTGDMPGKTHLDVARIKNIPSISDAPLENAVRSLPGISSSYEVPARFSFYGSRYDQNLFLLDGIPFYRPYHYFGLISAFHPRAIESVDVYQGVFPVRYDNAISGVIDATVNTVPENRLNWGLDADMLSAGAFLEWPVDERLKVFLSARSSWPDIGSSGSYYRNLVNFGRGYTTAIRDSLDHDVTRHNYFFPTRFYDMLGKAQYGFSKEARVALTVYYGEDVQGISSRITAATDSTAGRRIENSSYNKNVGISGRLCYNWNAHFNTTLSWVYYQTQDLTEVNYSPGLYWPVTSFGLRHQYLLLEGSYKSGNFRYDAGLKQFWMSMDRQIDGPDMQLLLNDYIGWFQFFWQDPGNLDITAGLQSTGFNNWLDFSIRLALGWQVFSNLKLTGAANGIFHSNLDAVIGGMTQRLGQTHSYESFVTYDNYNPVNTRVLGERPLTASYALGLHSSLGSIQIDANAWYIGYSDIFLGFDRDPEKLPDYDPYYGLIHIYEAGDAFAMGFDISLRKQYGSYQGQLSYTHSSFRYRLGNFGDNYDYRLWPYNLNREHQVKFIGQVNWGNWDLTLSETWASATGDVMVSYPEWLDPLPRGLPYYNRIDLSVKRSGLQIMDLNWTFTTGVLNVLNRPNIRLKVPYEQGYDNITYGLPRTFYAGLQVSLH